MDYVDFRFGNLRTKDLNLLVVSSSDRYEKNLLPDPTDYTADVPGGDGTYYFGSLFKDREFSCNIAFDSITEENFRTISQIFSTDKLQDLVFDELPYKTYRAKLKNKPEFKYICFKDDDGNRVYKGEGQLTFICYYPYAYCFNKYVVRAADYYLKNPPEKIIKTNSVYENPYEKKKQVIYNKLTKDYYNVENNMNTPWKGGYPTFEQVQAGELYFNTPDGEKSIIDTRRYWDNIPKWQKTAKLLTTPTLDYDQELIYAPQYSKVNYVNMDTGVNSANAIIGSRLLVYNPGDIPIDFEVKIDNRENAFHSSRGRHFQIRRMNVERLTIPQAVDWTGLKPFFKEDEEKYKYGNKYFKRVKIDIDSKTTDITVKLEDLKDAHPKHCYIVEPIPKERLGHFIKLFFWQSEQLARKNKERHYPTFEKGIELANRYEEQYGLCQTEEERQELYWNTLYLFLKEGYYNQASPETRTGKDFLFEYIQNPPEFIEREDNLKYGEFDFNQYHYPSFITEEYFDITTDDLELKSLYLDTEKEMLYNIDNPTNDFYHYEPKKKIQNESIRQGHWFKIPPGWSMIEVSPVCSREAFGGKLWRDARPFWWGRNPDTNIEGSEGRQKSHWLFKEKVYPKAAELYLKVIGRYDEYNPATMQPQELLDFRHMYKNIKSTTFGDGTFGEEMRQRKIQNLEMGFLRLLQTCWRETISTGQKQNSNVIRKVPYLTGDIDDWWWYANSYIWEHFPPLYWGYADILKEAQIKYTPLFY